MSDRAQVHVAGVGVYLYMHADGYEIYERVAQGLADAREAGRLHQPDVVAHFLSNSVIADETERGHGINSEPYEIAHRTVTVRPCDELVSVETTGEDDGDEGVYGLDVFIDTYRPNQTDEVKVVVR